MGLLRGGCGPASPPSAVIQDFNPTSVNDCAGYSSSQMVALMSEGTVTMDKAKEKGILTGITRLLTSDAPMSPLGTPR